MAGDNAAPAATAVTCNARVALGASTAGCLVGERLLGLVVGFGMVKREELSIKKTQGTKQIEIVGHQYVTPMSHDRHPLGVSVDAHRTTMALERLSVFGLWFFAAH